MAKASASCPAINEMHLESTSDLCSTDTASPQSDNECESDDGVLSGVSRKERILALKSTRRDRKREKDQQKKLQSNNISMDDFLSKQMEFKMWLKEEKNKQAKDLNSPKLKTYFKTFVKHWNRKKLNQKYYRGTELADTPQPSAVRQRFIFTDDSCYNTAVFPRTINLSMEGPDSMSSPFSTFGKSPLGLPITSGMSQRTPVSRGKVLSVPKDDTDKENRLEDIEDDTESAVNNKKTVSANSDITSPRTDSSLYQVSVLSWTSKGELTTDSKSPVPKPRRSKPVPPLHCPSLSEPQTLHREEYVAYQEIQEFSGFSTGISKQPMPVNYTDPGYIDPDCCARDDTKSITSDSKLGEQNIKIPHSPPAIYAVPVKKKKMAVTTGTGNSYMGIDVSATPPPVPPKRKSPLECWPYANSLMGTNIPAPCFSMNKAIQMEQSRDGELHSLKNNIQSSYNKNNDQPLNNYSVKPDHSDVRSAESIMNNRQCDSQTVSLKSCLTRPAHVSLVSERTETPPPQLVPIADSLCPSSSSITPADRNHSKFDKHPLSLDSCTALRYETTFSASDMESPIKTPCSVTQPSVSLTKSSESNPSHHQHATLSITDHVFEHTNINNERDDYNRHQNQTGGNNAHSYEKMSIATSSVSSNYHMSSLTKAECDASEKLSTEVQDTENRDDVKSPVSSQRESEMYETDIDDLDDDGDDCNDHGCGDSNMDHGFIETDLDKILEKVTEQNTASTHWLVNTDKETTV
ncbi:uncharacterized protein LOC121371819 isoform X2 [Gigantopelta aegis]|nr:uncharacterized protein LOC121371819 isoform X2 [Gigantopelta aegis]